MDDFNETPCPHCPDVLDQGTGYGHRADCPTFTEPHAIVRELAERGPYATLQPSGWYVCPHIGCHKRAHIDHDWFKNPANHEPSCLWRRAREWCAEVDR